MPLSSGVAESTRGRAAGARVPSGPPGPPRDSDDPPPGPRLPTAVLGLNPVPPHYSVSRAHPSTPPMTVRPGLPQPLPCSVPRAPPAPLTGGVLAAGQRASGVQGLPDFFRAAHGDALAAAFGPVRCRRGPGSPPQLPRARVRGCGWAGNFGRTGSESADSPDAPDRRGGPRGPPRPRRPLSAPCCAFIRRGRCSELTGSPATSLRGPQACRCVCWAAGFPCLLLCSGLRRRHGDSSNGELRKSHCRSSCAFPSS